MTARAEIIAVGNELLQGRTQDTNSGWLASRLLEIGVEVKAIRAIGDDMTGIGEALAAAAERADIVLVTGGLGPTSDDVTKEAVAAHFDDDLVLDEAVLGDIQGFLRRRGRTEMSSLSLGT